MRNASSRYPNFFPKTSPSAFTSNTVNPTTGRSSSGQPSIRSPMPSGLRCLLKFTISSCSVRTPSIDCRRPQPRLHSPSRDPFDRSALILFCRFLLKGLEYHVQYAPLLDLEFVEHGEAAPHGKTLVQILRFARRQDDDPVLVHALRHGKGEHLGPVQARHLEVDQEEVEVIRDFGEAFYRIIAGRDPEAGIMILDVLLEQLQKCRIIIDQQDFFHLFHSP